MRRISLLIMAIGLVTAACSGDSTDTTTQPTNEPTATTTSQAATTTKATASPTTTTAAPATTTTAGTAAEMVPATPVLGVLQPYPPVDAGALLFPPGSVEAHWYQWDGLYVVLYRGWDASDGSEICPGNSVLPPTGPWTNITNSPHNGDADAICIGTANFAEPPSGVYACGSLLYYLTEIPTESEGRLFGTLEIGDGEWAGQTSEAAIDLANTPEFEPGLAAYELLATNVDAGGVVECG